MSQERLDELRALFLEAKKLFGRGKVPVPPWEIAGEPATWKTAWQCCQIELDFGTVNGPYCSELRAYLHGLIAGRKFNAGEQLGNMLEDML